MCEETKKAILFAKKYGVKLTVVGEPEYKRYFSDDKEQRFVFKLRLTRDGRKYTFKFGQSIASGSEEPTLYDVLACLTKYDPEHFENFCSEYGYDTDSRKAYKTYLAVCREYEAVKRLFPEDEVISELSEIA
jgi:hypothetical protein